MPKNLALSSESTNQTKEEDKPKEQLEDTGQLFDKATYPGWNQKELDRYYATISSEKTKYLSKMAKQDKFTIKVFKPSPDLDNPDADLPIDFKDGAAEMLDFHAHDVTTNQWQVMQDLRNDLSNAEQVLREKVLNSDKGLPEEEMKALRDRANVADTRLYYYEAKIYFRMDKSLYNRCDRPMLRDACDAMTHRTIISIPNYPKISNQSYT